MGAFAEGLPEGKVWRSSALIVVLTGTNPYSFDRLVRPVDKLAGENAWDVFIQLGNTTYEPSNCRYERFVERSALMEMVSQAELVITQGGYGSIRDALLYDKAIVAVPRQPELKESTDRQEEIVHAMEQDGYLIGVYDIAQLEDAIGRARSFRPREREASRIPALLSAFVGAEQ